MGDSKDWIEVEKYLEQKEGEALEAEGIVLPPEHLKGYKYTPKTKIARKHPWEVHPVPNAKSTCWSANWNHKCVTFEVGAGIAYLTLSQPENNNALNDDIMLAL